MDIINICSNINNCLAMPATFIFLGTAIFLTIKTNFLQFRAFKRFLYLIKQPKIAGIEQTAKTINPFHALFTAMATTMGIGNIVGPAMAIISGGPGALFWLVIYGFLGSVTKFTEVTFALFTRKQTRDGQLIGGPSQYLSYIHLGLGKWYSFITLFLFAGWSGLQANTLAKILQRESISSYLTGLILAIILIIVLFGGAKRVGLFASKLVPFMFCLYAAFSLFIIFKDISSFKNAISLIFSNIFSPAAAVGGFIGASIFQAMRSGIYKGIFITEAGTGTSSIPHALADTKYPTDQGILAMYGVAAELFLCTMSGLVVLVTGVWQMQVPGGLNNTLIYEAFKNHAPLGGGYILILSIALFALTTVIGNSFNGGQSFAAITKYRFVKLYYLFAAVITFLGAISDVKLIWDIMDIFLVLVVVPNLIGIIILAFKYPNVLKIK
jgi:alanine or glycine:cation symporter, AGCS family